MQVHLHFFHQIVKTWGGKANCVLKWNLFKTNSSRKWMKGMKMDNI